MRFVADENVPRRIVLRLRADGHEVAYVIENVRSIRDASILQESVEAGAIILTLDKDFKRLVLTQQLPAMGIVWIRVAALHPNEQIERVAQAIAEQGEQLLHAFTTIYPDHTESESLV